MNVSLRDELRLSDFDYELPEGRIALRPARPRDAARMLVVQGARLTDSSVRELPAWLAPGDILVVNDTRVLSVQLSGIRQRADGVGKRPQIGVTLHKPLGAGRWAAFAQPAKKISVGDVLDFGAGAADVIAGPGGGEVVLDFAGVADFEAFLAAAGTMPLPPYIAGRRPADEGDRTDYQTMFAQAPGAVAAPTAGLHFTDALLGGLRARDIAIAKVTLHVGAGTFLPVKTENIRDHPMHAEWGEITEDVSNAINAARAGGGRVVAIGTTSLRLLETAASADGRVQAWRGETDIFITPGYRFRAADRLLTNFHLPRSTLLMLVAAFSGLGTIKRAYAHAVTAGYRFYSYGDATLLFPEGT